MQAHPHADLFPMMGETEYAELIKSMKQDGYHENEPIMLYEGMILDGRNRYKAAQELNILPMFTQFIGDNQSAYNLARSSNMARKHWSSDQWAMIAIDLLPYEHELAKERMSAGGKVGKEGVSKQTHLPDKDKGKSRDKAAAAVGVSGAKVQRADTLKKKNKNLAQAVKDGKKTLAEAEKEVKAQEKKLEKDKKEENRKQAETTTAETVYNVQYGQVWNCGNHIVMCGDAYKIDIQADAIITDPPYGIDYKPDWNKWDGSKSDFNPIIGDKYKFNPAPFLNYKTVLLFGANYYSDLLPLGGWLCWDKRTKEELDDMFGSPFELAWYRSAVTTKRAIMIRLLHGGVVNADSINGNNEKRYHATQKPIELMREIMELLVKKTDVIFDPFAGSGTTMLACERLGIKSVSIDIDPSNVEIILQRYEKETGVKPCQA